MTLFIIILSLVLIASLLKFIPKLSFLFIVTAILSVISSYFILTYIYIPSEQLFYKQQNEHIANSHCERYYRLVNAIKEYKLYVTDIKDFAPKIKEIFYKNDIYQNFSFYLSRNRNLLNFYDLSYYKGKLYIYWGITPVLLFYLPFNLLTGFYFSDNIIVFFLVSLIFILSIIILRTFIKDFLQYKISPSLQFLSIFLIGFCNYSLFLAIRPAINEVVISLAAVLLLLSIYLFLKYLLTSSQTCRNRIILLIGLSLALSVGARPHYVLFIPVFFIIIIYLEYIKTKHIKNILKTTLYFILPCIIYGTIVALYNYLRFDSIFEFGWTYQLNSLNQFEYNVNFKDFIIGFKNHFLQSPEIHKGSYTIFSLAQTYGHGIGNELIVGFVYVYPFSLFLLFIPFFIPQLNKKTLFIFIIILICFLINFCFDCTAGMIQRYSFEYIYILVILSLMIFYALQIYLKNKKIRKIIMISFTIIFIYTIYINISLLLCLQNAVFFMNEGNINFYTKLINFLFPNI